MTKETLLNEIDLIFQDGRKIEHSDIQEGQVQDFVEPEAFFRFRGNCLNIVRLLGEPGRLWLKIFEADRPYYSNFKAMSGTLTAIRNAVEKDLLVKIENLVLADEFANLLEQADHLLKNGYFLAAGVLGRAVLEDHLRTWCSRANCTPVKSKGHPMLNDYIQALYPNSITKITMMNATALAGIGNDAAHNAPTLTKPDVERLIRELPAFLENNPLP